MDLLTISNNHLLHIFCSISWAKIVHKALQHSPSWTWRCYLL